MTIIDFETHHFYFGSGEPTDVELRSMYNNERDMLSAIQHNYNTWYPTIEHVTSKTVVIMFPETFYTADIERIEKSGWSFISCHVKNNKLYLQFRRKDD